MKGSVPMKMLRSALRTAIFLLFLLALCGFAPDARAAEVTSGDAPAETGSGPEAPPPDCRALAALLQEQKELLTSETGRLRRDIAALRQRIDEPGMKEVFAGIGYIFGLAGIAMLVHARKAQGKD